MMEFCPRCNRSVPSLTHRGVCTECHDIPTAWEFQPVAITTDERETLEQAARILTSCGNGWRNYADAIAMLIRCATVREEEPQRIEQHARRYGKTLALESAKKIEVLERELATTKRMMATLCDPLSRRIDALGRDIDVMASQIAEIPDPLNWRIEALLKRIELLETQESIEGDATP